MDRRRFVFVALCSVVAPRQPAEAQQHAKPYRIGVLGNEDSPPWQSFRRGLRELGYVEGRNVAIEWRWYVGRIDQIPALAAELVSLKVDVIVTSGTAAVQPVKQATSTIPIVMAISTYPDKMGLVESLARPGGNVTGLSNLGPELVGKSLQVLKEIAPTVSRLAVLWNPGNRVETFTFKEVLAVAPSAGAEIQSIEVNRPEDYAAAFSAVTARRADALFAFGNSMNFKHRRLITDFAVKNRLPSLYQERLFVESGGLVSYAPSYIDLFGRASAYVDKILKGAKPADLPVEQPTKFELVINAKTAKALGLATPPSLLLRADQVIE